MPNKFQNGRTELPLYPPANRPFLFGDGQPYFRVKMVDAVMQGTEPEINDTETYDNGTGIIPSYLCDPVCVELGALGAVAVRGDEVFHPLLGLFSRPVRGCALGFLGLTGKDHQLAAVLQRTAHRQRLLHRGGRGVNSEIGLTVPKQRRTVCGRIERKFCPTSAWISPSSTCKLTLSSARTPGKSFTIFFISSKVFAKWNPSFNPVQDRTLSGSESRGIVIIHQELALVPYLTIGENMFLGNERGKKARIDWDETYNKADELLRMVGRITVILSATYETSFSLWEMMIQVIPCDLNSSIRSSSFWESVSLVDDFSEERIIKGMVGRELTDRFPRREPKIGVVEDQQLDVLGERLCDLNQLLFAHADVLNQRAR